MKAILLTCVVSLLATETLAVSSRNWGVTSRIAGLGGGTTFTEAPPVGPEPAFDGTTGFLTSDSGNIPGGLFNGEPYPSIQTGAEGTFALSQGFISAGGTYNAQSVAPNPTIFNGRGKVQVTFREDLIILPMAASPMGTLLDVRMALAAAHSADALGAPVGFESGLVTARFGASMAGGNKSFSAGQNRYFKSLPSTEIISGLAQTGVDEILATVAVGFAFQIQANLEIDAQGSVQTHGVGNVNNTVASGFALGTLAFGFEVLGPAPAPGPAAPAAAAGPEITFLSGGLAPRASDVSVAFAMANLPDFPLFGVPEPAPMLLLGVFSVLLASRRLR